MTKKQVKPKPKKPKREPRIKDLFTLADEIRDKILDLKEILDEFHTLWDEFKEVLNPKDEQKGA